MPLLIAKLGAREYHRATSPDDSTEHFEAIAVNGPNEMHIELRGADAASRCAEMAHQANREVESGRNDRSIDGIGS